MTARQLLSLILAALLVQLALGIAVVVRRRSVSPGQPPAHGPLTRVAPAGGAWLGWRAFRVVRRTDEDAALSQCSFHLQPVDGAPLPAFLPGQFLTFRLQTVALGGGPDGALALLTRCYSLSDRPDAASYRVTVKRVLPPAGRPDLPAGRASAYFHDAVQAGAILQVQAPAGRFFIDTDARVPVVLLAGGIGITPLMSMLCWCVAEQPARSVHLYYGVRNGSEHAFKRLLDSLAAQHRSFHLVTAYSQPAAGDVAGRDNQHAGRVDVDLLRRTLPQGRHLFYVCGPPAMMDSLVPALLQWGVPAQDVHFEAFGPASVRLPGSEVASAADAGAVDYAVNFSRSDRTLIWDGQDANLLDFTDRHGLAIESGCRSGSCGTCQTRLVSGTVHYDQAPDHDIAPGHCLLCVGRPASALVLEA